MSMRPQRLYEFGPYWLDTAEQLLLRDGKPVPLTPKAFETLVALVQRSGHLVEKDELMKAVVGSFRRRVEPEQQRVCAEKVARPR